MTIKLALPTLYDAVVARFLAEAGDTDPVPQVFGWVEPARRRSSSFRIVWVPGNDEANLDLGVITSARSTAQTSTSRPLATLDELFTVYVEARDASAPSDNKAQYIAARLLFDAWYRAVYKVARGTFEIVGARFVRPTNVSAAGATIRVLASIQAAIPDALATPAPTPTAAVTAQLGTAESFTTDEATPETITKDDEP